jgi:hypothetical protein
MQKAFLRCTATEMRWRKNVVAACRSWVTDSCNLTMSFTRLRACRPQTPDVPMTKGMKSTPAIISLYFSAFLSSAADAADPAGMLLDCT